MSQAVTQKLELSICIPQGDFENSEMAKTALPFVAIVLAGVWRCFWKQSWGAPTITGVHSDPNQKIVKLNRI